MCRNVKVGSVGILGGRQLPEAFLLWTVVTGSIRLLSRPPPPRLLYPLRKSMVPGLTVDRRLTMAVVPVSFTLKPTTATLLVAVSGTGCLVLWTLVLAVLVKRVRQPLKPASSMRRLKVLSGMLAHCGS